MAQADTEKKVKPLREKIGKLNDEIAGLNKSIGLKNTEISKQEGLIASYKTNTLLRYKDKYNYSKKMYAQTDPTKKIKKQKRICATGYPFSSSTCGKASFWDSQASQFGSKYNTAFKQAGIYTDNLEKLYDTRKDLFGDKATLQGEVTDLEQQISDIIAQDIAVAATDPDVLISANQAETDQALIKEEGKQRNLIIGGVIFVVLVIGVIIVIRST